jgi:hypothetical protein
MKTLLTHLKLAACFAGGALLVTAIQVAPLSHLLCGGPVHRGHWSVPEDLSTEGACAPPAVHVTSGQKIDASGRLQRLGSNRTVD